MTREEHRLSILAQLNQQSVAILLDNLSKAAFENEQLQAELVKLKASSGAAPAAESATGTG